MTQVLHVGLGRTGLPQALVAADSGFKVYGTDINAELLARLQAGQCPFEEPMMAELLGKHCGRSFNPVTLDQALELVSDCDYIVMAVTLQYDGAQKKASTDGMSATAQDLLRRPVKKDAVLILRSTMPVGTVARLRGTIEECCGKKEGRDYHLTFVPERLVEGQAVQEERTVPKIISGYSEKGLSLVEAFFRRIGGKVVRVSSPTVAEMVKLTDNSYRSTVFSFSNDLALAAESCGVDVLEVVNACNDSYPRNKIPLPGPVSGTCLGKDPYILESSTHIARRRGFHSLWCHGRQANDSLVDHVAQTLVGQFKSSAGDAPMRLLMLGMSYRENVDDYRMSHAVDIARRVLQLLPDATLSVWDPAIDTSLYARLPKDLEAATRGKHRELTAEVFRDVNAVILADRHNPLVASTGLESLKKLMEHRARPMVFYDCWNLWREAARLDQVVYRALGLGGPEVAR